METPPPRTVTWVYPYRVKCDACPTLIGCMSLEKAEMLSRARRLFCGSCTRAERSHLLHRTMLNRDQADATLSDNYKRHRTGVVPIEGLSRDSPMKGDVSDG